MVRKRITLISLVVKTSRVALGVGVYGARVLRKSYSWIEALIQSGH